MPVRLTTALTHDFALGLGFHEEITVGSRAVGAEAEKAVPVDVITAQQIEATGLSGDHAGHPEALAPSFNFPRPTITDGTDIRAAGDPARPRPRPGAGADQRQAPPHQRASSTSTAAIGRGSTGVDLNAIPVSAIERIEVLRDGAAAQYGSDAIAGVINIVAQVRRRRPWTLTVKRAARTTRLRRRADSTAARNYGFRTRPRSAPRHRRVPRSQRDQPRRQRPARPDPPGDGGNNAVPQPNHHWGDSDEQDIMTFVEPERAGGDERDDGSSTRFGGWSKREGSHGGFYRRGLDARNWPQIYPLGFLPLIEPDHHRLLRHRWASAARSRSGSGTPPAQYGHNSFEFNITDTLNVSLGPNIPPNQTDFYAGTLMFNHYLFNLDVAARVRDRPLRTAQRGGGGRGAAARTTRSWPASPRPTRTAAAAISSATSRPSGAQVFPGFRPANEVDETRDNVAAYVDLEGDVVGRLRLGLAGRYEHYSDFGSTADGKVTLRFEPMTAPHPARRRQHRLPRPVARTVVLLLHGDELRQRARTGSRSLRDR